MTEGWGATGRIAQDLGGHQQDVDPTNLFVDSISLSIFHGVHLAYVSPQLTHEHPQCFM